MTWDLDELDADPRNRGTVDPMEAVLRRRAEREAARIATNGHDPDTELDDADLLSLFHGLIVDIDTYRASVPTETPWRCRPIAYSGGVTLIAGPPKAGKSTLAAQLQRCCETGDDFLGSWPVVVSPVLLVTEEGGVAVVHKTMDMHQLEVLDRKAAISAGLSFERVIDVIRRWAELHPGGLVFIDTLAIWGEIENENDASEAGKAVALVTALAQATDMAVVLIHHARKSGGEHGEAIRGSGAILATVDIAVEHSRVGPGSDARWLDIQGRVILPERYLLSFDRVSMSYNIERQADILEEVEADLAGIPPDGPGLTRNEIRAIWHKDPRARLDQLIGLGRIRSEYVKTDRVWAHRHWSIPSVWTEPLRVDDD